MEYPQDNSFSHNSQVPSDPLSMRYTKQLLLCFIVQFLINRVNNIILRIAVSSSSKYLITYFIPRVLVAYILPPILFITVAMLVIFRIGLYVLQRPEGQLCVYLYTASCGVFTLLELLKIVITSISMFMSPIELSFAIFCTLLSMAAVGFDCYTTVKLGKEISKYN